MTLEEYFVSDSFFKSMSAVKNNLLNNNTADKIRLLNFIIGNAIKYSNLFLNNFDEKKLNNFISNITTFYATMEKPNEITLSDYVKDIFYNDFLSYLKTNKNSFDKLTDEYKKKAYEIITKSLGCNQYHSFNSNFLNSIKKHGINPNNKPYDQEDINKLFEIFSKTHTSHEILGFSKINCENQIFYAMTPDNAFYYGISSPEWFNYFTGGAEYANDKKNPKYVKDAFLNNDYDGAKNNIELYMEEKQINPDDKKIVMEIFEKYWEKYSNSNPVLAQIPFDNERTKKELNVNSTSFISMGLDLKNVFDVLFSIGIDIPSSQTVDVSNATFIKMPTLQEVTQKMSQQNDLSVVLDMNNR